MKVKVKFFTLFRLELGIGELSLEIEGDSVSVKRVLELVDEKTEKGILKKLLDSEDKVKTSAIILVNGKNIFHLQGLNTQIKDGDTVSLFPPGGGG